MRAIKKLLSRCVRLTERSEKERGAGGGCNEGGGGGNKDGTVAGVDEIEKPRGTRDRG